MKTQRHRRLALIALLAALPLSKAQAERITIPAFARQYRTACSTCHTAAPKLNALGEAFRLNGYRLPENSALLRKEAPVPLGADPWKDLWPRAIWPGEVPGTSPLALRVVSEATATRAPDEGPSFDLRMPSDLYLLAGASLGEGIAAFAEVEWEPGEDVAVRQAKVVFLNVLPWLPPRALNLWVGRQNLYLLALADPQVDRMSRQLFRWQEFDLSQVALTGPGGARHESANAFRLTEPQAALVAYGLLGGRTYLSAGVSRGASLGEDDTNGHKDVFYTMRHKFGGLRLDGTYDHGGGPPLEGGGQLLDRSLTLEHFLYAGAEPGAQGSSDRHVSAGVAARLALHRLELGVGAVRRVDDDPWGVGVGSLMRSVFARAEYMVFPWLFTTLRTEDLRLTLREGLDTPLSAEGRTGTDFSPGLVMLARQNVRVVIESRFGLRERAHDESSRPRSRSLALRLDFAF